MRLQILLVAAALLVSCGYHAGEEDAQETGVTTPRRIDAKGRIVLRAEERETLDLQTAVAQLGTLTTSALRFGRVSLRPQDDGLIVAPVTGRLGPPALPLGARAEKNDLVAVVEPVLDTASAASLATRRRELQGQITGARAYIRALESNLERVSTLASSHLSTGADKARAEADLEAEKARLEGLRQAEQELARTTGGTIELRAPFDGTIASLDTAEGSIVRQGTVVARVARDGRRWIDLAVPPGEDAGTSYRVRGTSRTFRAKLLNKGTSVQPDGTRRDRIETEPDAASEVLPGATVPVDVLREIEGVLAPAEAVVRRGPEKLVFVEVEANRFEARPIRVGARGGGKVALSSGLSGGERVVVRGAAALLGELGRHRKPAER